MLSSGISQQYGSMDSPWCIILNHTQGKVPHCWILFSQFKAYKPLTALDEPPPDNGPVHVLCQIMKQVVASTAEAELGVLFLNAQAICPFCIALGELGHLQPATPLQTDNSMASGIAYDTIKHKCSKAIEMHFYWVCNHVCQGQFHIFWSPENSNPANYFTKHHPASHHQAMQPMYLHVQSQPPITMHVWSHSIFLHILWGCVDGPSNLEAWASLKDSSNQDVTYHFNAESHDLPFQSQIAWPTNANPVTNFFQSQMHDLPMLI